MAAAQEDKSRVVYKDVAATITAVHTFAPAVASAPFILGTNALEQLVTGLNADLLDGSHASAFQPIDAGLTSLAALATTGVVVASAADTFITRTITGTSNQVTLANGTGVSGNPTVSLAGPHNFTTLTLNGVLYGNSTSAILATALGAANTVLTGTGAAPAFSGSPTLTRLTVTQAIGTAPFTVTSTTLVTNLNADLLDGLDSTAFALAAAVVSSLTGTANQITASSPTGAVTVSLAGPHNFTTQTLNGVLYGNASSAILATAQGAANTVLVANAGAPSFSTNPSVGSLAIVGAGGLGFITLLGQASDPASPAAGTLSYHATTTNGFTRLEIDNEGSTDLIVPRDSVTVVRNTSGGTLTKGSVVYVSGSTGNVPNIALAQANSSTTLPAVFVVLDTILDTAFGQALRSGILSSFDTSLFGSSGAPVYVSTTVAGGLTATKPSGTTNFIQRIGTVLVSGVGNGSLDVAVAPAIQNAETGTNAATWTGSALVGTALTLTNVLNVTSAGLFGFNVATDAAVLYRFGGSITSPGGAVQAVRYNSTVTGAAGQDIYHVRFSGTLVEAGSGAHSVVTGLLVDPPTITAGAATVTTAATIYISGATSASGAANYALYVNGAMRVNDSTTAPGTTAGTAIANFYGTSATNFLGTPDAWLAINVGGTAYRMALYV
jgi:hypothetical protein